MMVVVFMTVMVTNMIVMTMIAATLDVIVVAVAAEPGHDVIGMAMIVVAIMNAVFAVGMAAMPGRR